MVLAGFSWCRMSWFRMSWARISWFGISWFLVGCFLFLVGLLNLTLQFFQLSAGGSVWTAGT